MTTSADPSRPAAPPWPWAGVWRCAVAVVFATGAAGCASLPSNTGRTPSTALTAPEQTALGRLVQERRERESARSDSAFRLLENVDAAYSSRLALIREAQRTLDLQYYAIHADHSTEVLLQALRDAARRGVRVRILLDDFNTVGKDAQVLRLAFEPNVQMRLFNPLPGSRRSLLGRLFTSLHDLGRLQKRMHNKLFIADNAVGITGGRNLGDAYFGGDDKSNFVDLDVLAFGRIVRDMSASFDRYWNDELAYPMQTLVAPQELEAVRQPVEPPQPDASRPRPAPAPSIPPVTPTATILPSVTSTVAVTAAPAMDLRQLPVVWAPAVLLADAPAKIGPDDDEADAGETVVDGLLNLMRQARQDVLIVSPYFVPGPVMMAVFRELRSRGIRIRVLTNSLASNDAPAAHAGYARYRDALLALGLELHEMRASQEGTMTGLGSTPLPGSGGGGSKSASSRASLHSKAVIIDQRLAVIGSMNLDLRSQRKNSEVALLIRGAALSREAVRQVETTLAEGAYRLQLRDGRLVWEAPPGAPFRSARSEPDASAKLRLLARLIAPFAPDEML
ncbi:phospholipase D family protein [Ramlibacter sp.]|uniref:phospholipase D-like domain-containing protein n=1 Tax=Ramlibacter sp. TaxID=1917967 RepID=UPI002C6942A1|nr:phospholipase D family protein [Ramlibacter sp.]HWI81954.1 phospholipase D family protein [Ramlibacter sp.]